MKKIIKSTAIMAAIFAAFNTLIQPTAAVTAVIIVIAFFTGFLPVFIYETVKDMQPAKMPGNRGPHPFLAYVITPCVLFVVLALMSAPAPIATQRTYITTVAAKTAPVVLATKKAPKKASKHRQKRQNFKVNHCNKGYYIAGEIPNSFNSTFN